VQQQLYRRDHHHPRHTDGRLPGGRLRQQQHRRVGFGRREPDPERRHAALRRRGRRHRPPVHPRRLGDQRPRRLRLGRHPTRRRSRSATPTPPRR
jgi:hypothetical protein